MNIKKRKQGDLTHIQKRRGSEEWHRKRESRVQVLNFDFHTIEDEPGSDLEKQVVDTLAKAPSPQDILMDAERMDVLLKILPKVPLGKQERLVIELTLQGLNPIEINQKLGVDERSSRVNQSLIRAKKKIKIFLQSAGYMKYQKD